MSECTNKYKHNKHGNHAIEARVMRCGTLQVCDEIQAPGLPVTIENACPDPASVDLVIGTTSPNLSIAGLTTAPAAGGFEVTLTESVPPGCVEIGGELKLKCARIFVVDGDNGDDTAALAQSATIDYVCPAWYFPTGVSGIGQNRAIFAYDNVDVYCKPGVTITGYFYNGNPGINWRLYGHAIFSNSGSGGYCLALGNGAHGGSNIFFQFEEAGGPSTLTSSSSIFIGGTLDGQGLTQLTIRGRRVRSGCMDGFWFTCRGNCELDMEIDEFIQGPYQLVSWQNFAGVSGAPVKHRLVCPEMRITPGGIYGNLLQFKPCFVINRANVDVDFTGDMYNELTYPGSLPDYSGCVSMFNNFNNYPLQQVTINGNLYGLETRAICAGGQGAVKNTAGFLVLNGNASNNPDANVPVVYLGHPADAGATGGQFVLTVNNGHIYGGSGDSSGGVGGVENRQWGTIAMAASQTLYLNNCMVRNLKNYVIIDGTEAARNSCITCRPTVNTTNRQTIARVYHTAGTSANNAVGAFCMSLINTTDEYNSIDTHCNCSTQTLGTFAVNQTWTPTTLVPTLVLPPIQDF
jgi:hypothetical protein